MGVRMIFSIAGVEKAMSANRIKPRQRAMRKRTFILKSF
jgi:hypothetical protein